MRVKLLQNKYYYGSLPANAIVEVDNGTGERWINTDPPQAERVPDDTPITAGRELETKTVDELRAAANDVKIERTSTMKKDELVQTIREKGAES
jgi:hypothetical protein